MVRSALTVQENGEIWRGYRAGNSLRSISRALGRADRVRACAHRPRAHPDRRAVGQRDRRTLRESTYQVQRQAIAGMTSGDKAPNNVDRVRLAIEAVCSVSYRKGMRGAWQE